jgi:hypothetical protein
MAGGELRDRGVVRCSEHAVDHLLHEPRAGLERLESAAQERLDRRDAAGDVAVGKDLSLELLARRTEHLAHRTHAVG